MEEAPHGLLSVLRARLLVGYLGERSQYGWWQTAFYEQPSQTFLQPIFPKTIHLAQYHGVVEAARILHDEHLNVGTYHLFRLPEELEQNLHALAHDVAHNSFSTFTDGGKTAANDALSELAAKSRKEGIGPVSVGRVGDLIENLPEIASVYRSAFLAKTQSFPFLVS